MVLDMGPGNSATRVQVQFPASDKYQVMLMEWASQLNHSFLLDKQYVIEEISVYLVYVKYNIIVHKNNYHPFLFDFWLYHIRFP